MGTKVTFNNIAAGYTSATALNTAFSTISDEFDKVLYRDGEAPNTMSADLDMNSNDILNVASLTADTIVVGGTDIAAQVAAAVASAAAASTSAATAASEASNAQAQVALAAAQVALAEAAVDEFDDIYLGAKAVAPTVDNDGDPLAAGALYFNTGDNEIYKYNGSSWALAVTGGGGTGTVTSVAVADAGASEFTVTGSPVTTNGTINLAVNSIAGTKVTYSGGGNLDAAVAANASSISGLGSTYAVLASPALTGTPTAPTASANTNNTQIATTAYADNITIGTHAIYIPASAFVSRTTSGAASGSAETSTNKVMLKTYDFDSSADEFVQFDWKMPKSWNEGTITAVFDWSHAATTVNFGVAWFIQARAFADGDNLDNAYGTAVSSVDTGGTTNDIYSSPETAAMTVAGTPAAEEYVSFQIYRDVSDAGDTMAIDARLHGVTLFITTSADTDD